MLESGFLRSGPDRKSSLVNSKELFLVKMDLILLLECLGNATNQALNL